MDTPWRTGRTWGTWKRVGAAAQVSMGEGRKGGGARSLMNVMSENCSEKGSDPLQLYPRFSFSWTHRSQSPRAEAMWREGRTVNTQGRREDIWRLSQVGESGDRRLYRFLPSYVYSWLTMLWRRHVLGQDTALSTDKMHRRQDQELTVRYIKNW